MSILKYCKRLKTRFRNKFVYFPAVRIRTLEKRIKELETGSTISPEEQARLMVLELRRRIKAKQEKVSLKGKTVVKSYDAMLILQLIKKNLIATIGKCEKCQTNTFPLTLDHIIPRSILADFGINPTTYTDERNFRLLCQLCNSLKSHHLDFTDPRTKILLEEFLQNLPRSAS